MSEFRLQNKKIHLTYKNHQDIDGLLKHLEDVLGKLKYYSIVHENGETTQINEEVGNTDGRQGYAHTHVYVEACSRPNIRNATRFDYGGAHPHIKCVRSQAHSERIWKYHQKAIIEPESEHYRCSEISPVRGKFNLITYK